MSALPPSLLRALHSGGLVLAPTALAASTLRDLHSQHARTSGLAVWDPANVFSWQQWLHALWTDLIVRGHETRLLLSAIQEESLWQDILLPTLDASRRASAHAFAQLASSAYARAAAHSVLGRITAEAFTEDNEEFARWTEQFTRNCARHAYLPAAQLPAALLSHVKSRTVPAPPELHLSCFTDWTPADATLREALREAGTEIVEHTALTAPSGQRLLVRAATPADELQAAAHWLLKYFDEHLATDPASHLSRVHVVLADPNTDPMQVDAAFRDGLAPELNWIETDPSFAPWEYAAGRPLREQPLVTTLVRLLRGIVRPIATPDITALLLSPHLGSNTDGRDVAAQFDAWTFREHPPLRPELSLRDLARLAERSPYGEPVLIWLRPLLAFLDEGPDVASSQTYADWTAFIRRFARAAGWPGARPPVTIEQVAADAWDSLLDSVATLDFAGRRVPFATVLATLEHQLSNAHVAVSGRRMIQIVDSKEAAALPAEVLLLLGADETNWPPKARSHPLLPWSVQASAGMPGADAERDAASEERLTEAVFGPAKHVFVSFAAERDEAPQRLAPALAQLAHSQLWESLAASDLLPPDEARVECETVIDDAPLPPLPSSHVPGGAAVLQSQAACGFRAFATIRLRSTTPRSAGLGVDAARAGSILHHALDVFWTKVGSQADLLELSNEELTTHLWQAVGEAFGKVPVFNAVTDSWGKAYRKLQMERLFELLREWLAIETARAPFSVAKREQETELQVGPLTLNLRVDRVDTVDNGAGMVLIDYKTGANVRPSAWESDRPDEPQLPLYALLARTSELRGVAFARVRQGELGFAGSQSEPDVLGKIRLEADFDSLVARWRSILTELAQRFAEGDISVHPKSFPKTCLYCEQRLLCRYNPNSLESGEGNVDEDEERNDEEHLYG